MNTIEKGWDESKLKTIDPEAEGLSLEAGDVPGTDHGFIIRHRSDMGKPWYKKSDYAHLWEHLNFRANHKDKIILLNGKNFLLKRGSFITSRKILKEETGIQESKIERILKYLKGEQQIEQLNMLKYRLITVLYYDRSQKVNSKVNSQ